MLAALAFICAFSWSAVRTVEGIGARVEGPVGIREIGLACLLLDFQRRSTPSTASAEEILQADPAFSEPFSKPHENWLAAPLRMHCLYLLSYSFHMNLEMECPVPGSYALDAVATVRSRSQPERRFSMFRFKRYDEEKLRQSLARVGWEQVASLSFGVAEKASVAMLLVKRGNSPAA